MHFDYASLALSQPANQGGSFGSSVDHILTRGEKKRGIPLTRAILLLFIAFATAYLYFYTTFSLLEIGAMIMSWLLFLLLGVLICGLIGYLLWGLTDFAVSIELKKDSS